MPYTKTIVCLANSWKKNGSCVAGIEWPPSRPAEWVRPVSDRQHEELEWPENTIEGRHAVALLDVIELPLIEHRPRSCQTENHLIDASQRWRRVGKLAATELLPLVGTHSPLWIDGRSTGGGVNDKIPEDAANSLDSSLCLIHASKVTVRVVGKPTQNGGEKTQCRLNFALDSTVYDLSVTDPVAHGSFAALGRGDHLLDHSLAICVSLSEPGYGYRYKLAAGVIHLPE